MFLGRELITKIISSTSIQRADGLLLVFRMKTKIHLCQNEKRKSQTVNIPYHDVKKSKVVLLSDETLSKSVVEETRSQDLLPQKKVPTSFQSSKLASNLDQLVQMNDGTFVFMKEDGAGETEDSDIDEPVQEESQVCKI